MVEFSYGGFDAMAFEKDAHNPDIMKAWEKLSILGETLERADPIPPHIAQWMGRAINKAWGELEGNPSNNPSRDAVKEFTRALGLTVGRGNEDSQNLSWLIWGRMIDRLLEERDANGQKVNTIESAVAEVRAAMEREDWVPVGKTSLLKYREKYLDVRNTHNAISRSEED